MRYKKPVPGLWVKLLVVLGWLLVSVPALAESGDELDGVTMRMVTDEDELSRDMMREIELHEPVGLETLDDRPGVSDEIHPDLRDETGTLTDDLSDDVITDSGSNLLDGIGDVDDELLDESGDLLVPVDDLMGDTLDESEDLVDDTGDELDDVLNP